MWIEYFEDALESDPARVKKIIGDEGDDAFITDDEGFNAVERANAVEDMAEVYRLLETWGRGKSGTEPIDESQIQDAATRNEVLFDEKNPSLPE